MHQEQIISITQAKYEPQVLDNILARFESVIITRYGKPAYFVLKLDDAAAEYLLEGTMSRGMLSAE